MITILTQTKQAVTTNTQKLLTDNTTVMRGIRLVVWFLISTYAYPVTISTLHYVVAHPESYSAGVIGGSMLVLELLTSLFNPKLKNV